MIAALACAAACHKSAPAAPAPSKPAAAAPARHDVGATLAVIVNGKPAARWSATDIARSASISVTNQNGEEREGWPLKPLTKALLGDKARIVALDAGDERVPIDEKAWNDPSQTLVLRLSHRGAYKAHWVQDGHTDEAFLKGVDRIEVVQ